MIPTPTAQELYFWAHVCGMAALVVIAACAVFLCFKAAELADEAMKIRTEREFEAARRDEAKRNRQDSPFRK